MTVLLDVRGVTKRFRGLTAVDNVSLSVAEGQIFAVIGPNGAGKTTLFNMIAGEMTPDSGSITFAGERADGVPPHELCRRGLARTFQIVRPFPELTVLENATIGAMMRAPDMDAARAVAGEVLRRLDLWDRRDAKAK
jgi:branched-chain amino acid transport system ATP-binding protein